MASSNKNLSDPELTAQFDARIAAEAKALAATGRPDVDDALRAFREKRPGHVLNMRQRRWWPATAAAAIILIGVATFIITHPSTKTGQAKWLITDAGATGRIQTLPDGSSVRLSPQASMSYPAKFLTDRQVRLSGDAFFTVAHDAANPFRVQAKDITITVLGTSFSIVARAGQTEVAVAEGLVEVARKQQRIRLARREKLLVPSDTGAWQKLTDTVITPASVQPKSILRPVVPKPSLSALPLKKSIDTLKDDNTVRLNIMRSILDDLVKEHCAPDLESIGSATLDQSGLFVNGVRQPEYLLEKFKEKYLNASGNGYYYGHVQITGRGYFFDKNDLDAPPQRPRPAKFRADSIIKPHPRAVISTWN
jgi:hypothetical protein